MIDSLFVLIIGGAYFMSAYKIAFWVTLFAILNGLLAVGKTISDPTWYIQKKVDAGLEPELDIKFLIIMKAVLIVPLCFFAWYLAGLAGYR